MKRLKPILFALLLLTATSCEDLVDALISNTTVLTQAPFVFDSVSGYDDFTNNLINALAVGSTYDFDADGTYTTGGAFGDGSGTWAFNSNETQILLDGGGGEDTWTIVELTASKLSVTYPDADALNGTATLNLKR